MTLDSSPRIPSLDALRSIVESGGVQPADADLEAARRFLETILPALEELERAVPGETVPAGLPESAA